MVPTCGKRLLHPIGGKRLVHPIGATSYDCRQHKSCSPQLPIHLLVHAGMQTASFRFGDSLVKKYIYTFKSQYASESLGGWVG